MKMSANNFKSIDDIKLIFFIIYINIDGLVFGKLNIIKN